MLGVGLSDCSYPCSVNRDLRHLKIAKEMLNRIASVFLQFAAKALHRLRHFSYGAERRLVFAMRRRKAIDNVARNASDQF